MTCMFKVIHYCFQMYLQTLETSVSKYMKSILLIFCLHQDKHGKLCLKKTEVKLELLTKIDMLLKAEKVIRGGICYAIHRYANVSNKYMKNHDKKIISPYLMYLDANNLYGWAMSQKPPVNGFKWLKKSSKFDEHFIKNYDENSDKGYFLEVDVEYPNKIIQELQLMELHSVFIVIYHFYPKEIKLKNAISLFAAYATKKTMSLLNQGLILKRVHTVIQFNQGAWLNPYIDMNTKLRTEAKNYFEKDFFKLMNVVFGKTIENVRKHRDIKLVTTEEIN